LSAIDDAMNAEREAEIDAAHDAFVAYVMLDGRKLVIVNREKLPAGAMDFIKKHAAQIADFLTSEGDFEERAAIIEFDGGLSRPAAEYLARLLHSSPPKDANPADWSWFVGQASEIVERDLQRGAAA
jgi:hypothetical protein